MHHHRRLLGLVEVYSEGTNNSNNNLSSSSRLEVEVVDCLVDSERPNLPNLLLEGVYSGLQAINPKLRRRVEEVCSADNNLRIPTPVNQPLAVFSDPNNNHNSSSNSSNQQDYLVRPTNNSLGSRLRYLDPRVNSLNSREEVYLVNLRTNPRKVYNWVDLPIPQLSLRVE